MTATPQEQPEQTRDDEGAGGRRQSDRRSFLAVALGTLATALLTFAYLSLIDRFKEQVDFARGTVTVECGNVFEARDLEQVVFPKAEDFRELQSMSTPEIAQVVQAGRDACRDTSTRRITRSVVAGVLGLAALVTAIVLVVRKPRRETG